MYQKIELPHHNAGVEEISDAGSSVQAPYKAEQKIKMPYEYMIFDSLEAAKEYYEKYARQEGFYIHTQTSSDSHVEEFVCSHERNYEEEKQNKDDRVLSENPKKRRASAVDFQCKAGMRVVYLKRLKMWKVTMFNDNHNHVKEHLPAGKVGSVCGRDIIGFDGMYCSNHLSSTKKYKKPIPGDAAAVLNFFKNKSMENPQFYYAIQPDAKGRAINYFWVDGRSRIQYQHFGDVVSFDTSYKTNLYSMPFAPFTGVNHHLQPIQFGCAMLLDDSEDTFVWLLKTWLGAMGGRPPTSIITDENPDMIAAVGRVLPHTRHRLCLRHVMKKFGKRLSQVYFRKSPFKKELKQCILETYRVDDFEVKWKEIIRKFGLGEHSWLTQIYDNRKKWVPVYHFNTFHAGMNTTGCSKGMNSFYCKIFSKATTLTEFAYNNERALERISKRERDENYESEHKNYIAEPGDYLLEHATKLYTRNVFAKFKTEWHKAWGDYKVLIEERGQEYNTYTLGSRKYDQYKWIVQLNLTTKEGRCECKYFEYMGIPCGHILKIFIRQDIDDVPDNFIVKRWTTGANRYRITDGMELRSGQENSEVLRLCRGSQVATQVVFDAAETYETYTMLIETLTQLSENIAKHKESLKSGMASNKVTRINASEVLLLDHKISQTKGSKNDDMGCNSSRIRSVLNKSQSKKTRKCGLCNGTEHDKRNCPENPKRKKKESSKQIS